MKIYIDATPLISLGKIGELQLLQNLDGAKIILPEVKQEVNKEPAKSNVEHLIDSQDIVTKDEVTKEYIEKAKEVLNEKEVNGDVRITADVLYHRKQDIAVVSDDRRVRFISKGFGAKVTGTVGIVVRAVSHDLSREEGKRLIRELDSHGLYRTAELRDKAIDLIEDVG